MSDPSNIPGFSSPASSTAPAAEKPEKKSVTRRDVTEAIASFAPARAPEPTPAEKERAKRKDLVSNRVRGLVEQLQNLGVDLGTPADALAVFRGLANVEKKAHAAIDSLREQHLGIETAPKAPRAPKSAPVEEVAEPETAQVDDRTLASDEERVVSGAPVEEPVNPSTPGSPGF